MTQDLNPDDLYNLVRADTFSRNSDNDFIMTSGTKANMQTVADILNSDPYKSMFALYKVIKA